MKTTLPLDYYFKAEAEEHQLMTAYEIFVQLPILA